MKNGTGSARIFAIRGAQDQYAALQVGTTISSSASVRNDTGGSTAYTALQLGVTTNGWTATTGTGIGAETLFGGILDNAVTSYAAQRDSDVQAALAAAVSTANDTQLANAATALGVTIPQ
jgi:hypothetical protein